MNKKTLQNLVLNRCSGFHHPGISLILTIYFDTLFNIGNNTVMISTANLSLNFRLFSKDKFLKGKDKY